MRCPQRESDGRYISKNNGNIARLDLIAKLFPDARILVPIRHPVEHAHSLLNQHCNFSRMHKKEPFNRRYMEDIGHYEFGQLHRPISFPDLDKWLAGKDPVALDYWLAYWIAAFDFISARRDKLILVSYETTCDRSKDALIDMCRMLDIDSEDQLENAAALFHRPPRPKGDADVRDRALLASAYALYEELLKYTI